ncbi:hypothetical protein V6N13_048023 [Hibiscus sabdariffa]
MSTNEIIPHLYVDVEPMCYRIPLKGAVKQGSPEKGWAKVKLEVVAIIINQYLHFFWHKNRLTQDKKRRQSEQQDD